MGYRFELSDRSVEAGLRRIAAEEVADALAALDDTARPLPERIHEARKAVKKLRGLIRLVRPRFGAYAAENTALRDAGRRISGLRESEVTRHLLDTVADATRLTPEDHAAAAGVLAERHAEEHADLDAAVADFRSALGKVARRARRWKIEGAGFDVLEEGLADTWTRTGKAMKRALKKRHDEDFHDWRKRAKDHWYQARLLEPVWPGMMAPHVAAADRLGEALGEYNDLSVLIRDLARGDAADAARAPLVDEACRRREALVIEAAALGGRLFAGPAEALTARWRVWWEVWRG